MGNSSSQNMGNSQGPTRSGAGSPMAQPHYTPTMDDEAASQQLIDETAHADGPIGGDASFPANGSANVPSSERKKRKKHSARKSMKESPFSSLADSQDPLAPKAALQSSPPLDSKPQPQPQPQPHDMDEDAKAHKIQIPDSQTLAVTTSTPMSPIVASSSFVPASLTKSKRTYKKNMRSVLSEDAERNEADEANEADAVVGAHTAASPSHRPSKRKRSRKSNTEPESSNNVELEVAQATMTDPAREDEAEEVDVTPAHAKREKKSKPKPASGAHDKLDLEDHAASRAEKKRRKRDKNSKARRSDAEAAQSEPFEDKPAFHGDAGAAIANGQHQSGVEEDGTLMTVNRDRASAEDAADSENLANTDTPMKRNERKEGQKDDLQVPESPVTDFSFSPFVEASQPGKEDDDEGPEDIYAEPNSSGEDEDDVPHERPASSNHSIKRRREKKVRSSDTPLKKSRKSNGLPRAIRKSDVTPTNAATSAEKALNTTRELGHPPDLRRVGDFSQDEEELIRRAIRDYQERKGLDITELVDIIQWTTDDVDRTNVHNKNDWSAQEKEDANESSEFWAEMKSVNLTRKFDIIRRHIRTTYHQYKNGGWTEEEDEQLRNLYALHPNRWKFISTSIGDRSMHDCQNRWRDYLQYGNKRNVATWSNDEVELLIRAVNTVAQRDEDARAETGQPPLEEYTNKDISWPQVSREMGGIRSRIQASVKWSKLRQRTDPPQIQVEHKPRKEFVQSPVPAPTPALTSTVKKKRGRPRKSEIVDREQTQKRLKPERPHVPESPRVPEPESPRMSEPESPRMSEPESLHVSEPESPRVSEPESVHVPEPESPRVPEPERLHVSEPDSHQEHDLQADSVDKMMWGDKFDLIYALADRRDDSEEDIDWDSIAKAQTQPCPWSIQTLQAALQELIQLLRDNGTEVDEEDFPGTIDDIMEFITSEHAEELEEHYRPEEVAPKDDEKTVNPAAASPSSSKKRDRKASDGAQAESSEKKPRKKRRTKAEITAANSPKSSMLVAESDDAESEPEP